MHVADVGQFVFGEVVVHVLLMIDEASRFAVAHELYRQPKTEQRNPTSQEIILALERSWIAYHGLPNVLRTDPEGCFRGTELEEWAASRGVELRPCPGEAHEQIGIVERTIGSLKTAVRAFLRNHDCDPFLGILQMVQAHNEMDRVGGYAPCQWAYARLPSWGRLFEGGNHVPVHSTEAILGTDLRANLNLRVQAEEVYRKSMAAQRISRAMNSQPQRVEVFLPGDLVYYRRYKTPRSQNASHPQLDTGKVGLARWFGPARVLATETKSDIEPDTRKPGGVVWIVGAGRLKRCSPRQLRHCSEREKLAEKSEAITTPWSFNSLMHLVERGQFQRFDDLHEDEDKPQFRERKDRSTRVASRAASRGRSRSKPAVRTAQEIEKTQTTVDKDGQPRKAAATKSKLGGGSWTTSREEQESRRSRT